MRDVLCLILILEATQSLLIHPPKNRRHFSTRTSSCHTSASFPDRRCGRRRVLLLAETRNDSDDSSERIDMDLSSTAEGLGAFHHNKPLEEDIAKRLSLSRDRAISALSQPNSNQPNANQQSQEVVAQSSLLPLPPQSLSKKQQQHQQQQQQQQRTSRQQQEQPRDQRRSSSNRATLKRNVKKPNQPTSSASTPSPLLPPPINSNEDDESSAKSPASSNNNNNNNNNSPRRTQAKRQPYSSLLPPPLPREDSDESNKPNEDDDALSYGLSSWEEFLGGGKRRTKPSEPTAPTKPSASLLPTTIGKEQATKPYVDTKPLASATSERLAKDPSINIARLPSIRDLFPPDFSNPKPLPSSSISTKSDTSTATPVTPGSSKAASSPFDGILPVSDLFYRSSQSIEASDDDGDESMDEDGVSQENDDDDDGDNVGLSPRGDDEELPFSAEQSDQLTTDHNKIRIRRNTAAMSVHAKLEAAVAAPKSGATNKRSAKASGTSSSATKTPRRRGINRIVRRGMEMLVGGVPINADPPQRCIELIYQPLEQVGDWSRVITLNSRDFGPLLDSSTCHLVTEVEKGLFCEYFVQAAMKWDVCPKDLRDIVKQHCVGQAVSNTVPTPSTGSAAKSSLFGQKERGKGAMATNEENSEENILSLMRLVDEDDDLSPAINSNKKKQASEEPKSKSPARNEEDESFFRFGGDLVFDIGVSREELESGTGGEHGGIVRQVLIRGISAAIDKELKGFLVHIAALVITEKDDGTTSISAEFCLQPQEPMSYQQAKHRYQRVKASLAQAMDDGDMQLAMAAAAREETRWSEKIRDRVVEEFLFEEDDVPYDEEEGTERNPNVQNKNDLSNSDDEYEEHGDGPLVSNDGLFIGGGNDGVFFDFSAANILNAPFQGELGPRLVEAVLERVKQRPPRVIAIGDVHGCIDELQDLLQQCDYQPGDLVIFLGDMVSKGPDSSSVVQMAREIGAIGVRGNHDFEVIRWHQAIKSGVDPPVVGSEHFHVASCLSKADMKWLHSLPWYVSSKELGALFVHAGFVSGIRLAKQNPRLMMNMRSILPDGTVTSKFFNNWPWARLWDGPQTVLFGHDADRGLQQYEHAIGLDTGCVYGGRLTACILPEKRLVSVSAKREYFKYRRKHYD